MIDAPDLTAMPGMMDLHLHIGQFNSLTFRNYRVAQWEITPELQQLYMLFHAQLCFERGFTTLRDEGLMSTPRAPDRAHHRRARRHRVRHLPGPAS